MSEVDYFFFFLFTISMFDILQNYLSKVSLGIENKYISLKGSKLLIFAGRTELKYKLRNF